MFSTSTSKNKNDHVLDHSIYLDQSPERDASCSNDRTCRTMCSQEFGIDFIHNRIVLDILEIDLDTPMLEYHLMERDLKSDTHVDLDDFAQAASDVLGHDLDVIHTSQCLCDDISRTDECSCIRSQRQIARYVQMIARDNCLGGRSGKNCRSYK
jgi:hypothetical protein